MQLWGKYIYYQGKKTKNIFSVNLVAFIQYVFVIFGRYVLEKVDLVIVGAEGVVESGGIINKVRFSEKSTESGSL